MGDSENYSIIGIVFRAASLISAVGVVLHLSITIVSDAAFPSPIYEGYEMVGPIVNAEDEVLDSISLPLSLTPEPHMGTLSTRLSVLMNSKNPGDLEQFCKAREVQDIEVEKVVDLLYSNEISGGTGIFENVGGYKFQMPGVGYVLSVGSPDKRVILAALKQILDNMLPTVPCIDFHVGLRTDMEETMSTYFSFDRGDFRYALHLYRFPLSSRYKDDIRAPTDYFGMVLVLTDNRSTYPNKWWGMGIKPVDRRPAIEFWQLPANFDCL